MILSFKTKKQETNASARVVDGKLILSLPDAITPIVWQMDLSTAKASALEVREDTERSAFTLALKTPKGEALDVASFDERAHAVEGLMAASSALENAHGQIQTADGSAAGTSSDAPANVARAPETTKHKRGSWMKVLLALVVLFILFVIWSSVLPRAINTGGGFAPTNASGTTPQSSSGVPVSADAFLRGQ